MNNPSSKAILKEIEGALQSQGKIFAVMDVDGDIILCNTFTKSMDLSLAMAAALIDEQQYINAVSNAIVIAKDAIEEGFKLKDVQSTDTTNT